MKLKILIGLLLIPVVLFLMMIPFVRGSSIPLYSNPIILGITIQIYTILFYLTYIIKFNVIKFNVSIYDNTKRSKLRKAIVSDNLLKSKLRKAVVSVNLLTYPVIQMVTIISIQTKFFFYLIIELIPVILEFLLFLKIYRQFLGRGYFRSPIPAKVAGLSIIEANLVTFVISVIFNFFTIVWVVNIFSMSSYGAQYV